MFGLTQIEERLAFLALITLLVVGFGLFYTYHERSIGAQKCEMSDAQVAAVQKAAAATQEAQDAARLKDAQDSYHAELAALQHSSVPPTHLVCVAPRPVGVSEAATISTAASTTAGVLPTEGAFDPGPALDALHDEADQLIASCRMLNAAVPH